MSSKPKQSEYSASESEKATASIALADKQYFKDKYLPKLTELRDRSSKEDYQGVARGRAQADTMQALTNRPSLQATRSVDAAADRAAAAGSQLLQGSLQGLAAQRGDQVNVLKQARGMAADATSGLSRAAKIATTKNLQFAQAKQNRRNANFKLATSTIEQMGQNRQENLGLAAAGGTAKTNANKGFFKSFLPAGMG
tara:strand:+ start:557 stop:1147 length:591 start_codon:yes stop_codon:yes gene_type:complete